MIDRDLELLLGHIFTDASLLSAALTMPSWRMDHPEAKSDNQRLEFLGDAVVGLLAGQRLFELYPAASEGWLTQMRSRLTSGDALGACGQALKLERWLLRGRGEVIGGLRRKALADAVEALFAALYLDGGLEAARAFFNTVYPPDRLAGLLREPEAALNPKGELIQWAQSRALPLPVYELLAVDGARHAPRFEVKVTLGAGLAENGEGPSRRAAEAEAAAKLLTRIKETP